MLFSSIPFLYYFLPLTLLCYFLAPRRAKNAVLLLFSLVFYAWGEPKYVLFMVVSILQGYFFGRLVEKYRISNPRRSKLFLTASVLFSLLLLGYCKYADFFIRSFNAVTGLSVPLLRVALPIGISFYTFQILSYVVDVHRGTVAAQRNLIGKVNLATQIILNLGLCYGTLYLGPMWGNFLYFALEVLVFSVEAFVYNRYLPWPEGKKPHPILYALTANLLSFGIGLELNTHCTNTQIRLIGLICLVLWYAGPWLCRKLQKVQNAQ